MLQFIAVTGLLTGLIHVREIPSINPNSHVLAIHTAAQYSRDTIPRSSDEVVSQLPPQQRYANESDVVTPALMQARITKDSSPVKKTVHHPQPARPSAGEGHEALPVRLEGHEAVWQMLSN